ncbi:hypothetical protein D1872_226160 [compost metagenome]
MLISAGIPQNRRNMDAALVGEGRRPHIRLVDRHVNIGDFADVTRRIGQLLQLVLLQNLVAQLELEVGNDGAQIGVAAALAVTVHRSLDLFRAGPYRAKRIGHRQLAIVMGVNAQTGVCHASCQHADDVMHFMRHRSAVRVAHDEPIGPGCFRFGHDGKGVFGVVLVAVKEMLGVENNLKTLALQISDGVVDHRQVFFQRGLQRRVDVEVPRFADERGGLNSRFDHPLQIRVMLGQAVFSPCASESRDLCLKLQFLYALEKLDVLVVAAGDAPFNIMDTQLIQLLGNLQLIVGR